MDYPYQFFISIILAYLLGSIPSGYWLGKMVKGIDLRKEGSGNMGATNAFRVLGKPLGITTLILDMAKGWLAVKLSQWVFGLTADWAIVLVGLATVFGHIFTIFLRFKGGKGVATTFGIFLAFTPIPTLITMLIWLITLLITRYASMSSIICAICFPILIFFISHSTIYTFLSIILGLFIILRHSSNIKRLMNGTENKFSLTTANPKD